MIVPIYAKVSLYINKRPCAEDKLLGVSTHNLTEALKAQSIGADFSYSV
jgi:8-oxo-dGTP diphosphatase